MEATESTNPAGDDLPSMAECLRRVLDDTDQLLKSAAASGDQKFQAAREKVVAQMVLAREQLAALDAAGRQKAREAARVTDEAVHEHPYGAMAVAAAAGVLIGLIVARR